MPPLILDLADRWVRGVTHDTQRYVIFAVATWLVLCVALAPLLRRRKIREQTPPARQMLFEFLFSIRSIAVFSTVSLSVTLLDRAGFYPLSRLGASWGPGWFWISVVLMIVGHDTYFYWVHRAMHHPRLFRAFHRRHHRSHNPTPFTAYSFDLGEAFLMVSYVVLWPLVVPTPWPVIDLFMIHQIFRNTLLHSGYELMPARRDGRPMLDWLTTTTHHDMHHGQGWNYGVYFTWWDRWMGTEHPDYHAAYARAAGRPLLALDPQAGGASPAPSRYV